MTGTIGSPDVWPQTIRFMSAAGIDLSPMVSTRFDLADAVDALDAAEGSRPARQGAHHLGGVILHSIAKPASMPTGARLRPWPGGR